MAVTTAAFQPGERRRGGHTAFSEGCDSVAQITSAYLPLARSWSHGLVAREAGKGSLCLVVVGPRKPFFPRKKGEWNVGMTSSLCHCRGDLRSRECALARLTSQLGTASTSCSLSSQPRPNPEGGLPSPIPQRPDPRALVSFLMSLPLCAGGQVCVGQRNLALGAFVPFDMIRPGAGDGGAEFVRQS